LQIELYVENMADEHVEPVEAVELSSDSESDAETAGINSHLRALPALSGFEADEDERILVAEKRKQRAVTCNRCKKKLK